MRRSSVRSCGSLKTKIQICGWQSQPRSPRRDPKCIFSLPGYGKLLDRMVHRIDLLGLRDRVFLPGAVTEPEKIYAALMSSSLLH